MKDQIKFIRKNVDGGQESLEYQDRIVNDLDQGLPEIPSEMGNKSVKDNLPVDVEQTISAKDSNDKTEDLTGNPWNAITGRFLR